ncbi:imidazole glycerol phosphate synthase subunit HisH [Microbulbifer sp. ARAS458-1]|uniref:imidazole glycerol phosphate synthase subunit HisH n=1 Tax=Microbulbifer sp. ARAS458-1 TaxID=3140242 RepID=UPI003877EE25
MQKIVVLDYGMGNLHSVASALKKVAPGDEVVLATTPQEAEGADRLIVPGVGAIRDCVEGFIRPGFVPLLNQCVESGMPILGICVGMQIMMASSEENGGVDCLGIFPQPVKFFGTDLHDEGAIGARGARLKVPHMGWNRVQQKIDHPMWKGIENGSRFYFVHSYYVPSEGNDAVAGETDYGVQFAAAVTRNNIFATQFHPEKSADAGMQLLTNFVSWNGSN